jgi:RecA-family ATPase
MDKVIPLEAAEAWERLRPVQWGDLGSLPRREPLVKRLIECGALSVIYGESNCGKSFFALDLAENIARGVPWRDRRVKQCPVILLGRRGRTRHRGTPDSLPVPSRY